MDRLHLYTMLGAGMVILGFGVGVGIAVRPDLKICSLCRREIVPRMAYLIKLEDGRSKKVCCPRCCFTYQIQTGAKVAKAWATDFFTGEEIDAALAFYVEGSELTPCCAGTSVKVDECKIGYYRGWGRCLPSLIAFDMLASAISFRREHGGSVVTYAEMQGKRLEER